MNSAYNTGVRRALEKLGLEYAPTTPDEINLARDNVYDNDRRHEPPAGLGIRPTTKTALTMADPDSPESQAAYAAWDKKWNQQGVAAEEFLANEPGLTDNNRRIFSESLQKWPGLRITTQHRQVMTPRGPGLQRHYQMVQAQRKEALYTTGNTETPETRQMGTETQGAGLLGSQPPQPVEPSSTVSPSQPPVPPMGPRR